MNFTNFKLRFFIILSLLISTSAFAKPHLLVTNTSGNSIVKYDQDKAKYLGQLVAPGVGGLNEPDSMVIGPDGMLYVSSGVSAKESAILKFNPKSGKFLGRFASGRGMRRPYGIAFGPDNNLYVASFRSDEILVFKGRNGKFLRVLARGNQKPGGVNGPTGLAFGPDGHLYVTTQGSVADKNGDITYPGLPSEVLRFNIKSRKSKVFIHQPEPSPEGFGFVSLLGLAFGPDCDHKNPAFCDLFVSDFANDIRRYSLNGKKLKAVLSTNYTGTQPSENFVGSIAFGKKRRLFATAFNNANNANPGAILRYNGVNNRPMPLSKKSGHAVFVSDGKKLKRPIGILALP